MGCNCGGAKNASREWAYTHPTTKKVTVYRSEVQARAAQIRNGGGTYESKAKTR